MTRKSISISDIVNHSKVKLKVIPYLIFIDLPFPILCSFYFIFRVLDYEKYIHTQT